VFTAPLRRLTIQVPTQLFAAAMLLLFAPGHTGHRPVTAGVFGAIGAVALSGVGLLLFVARQPVDDPEGSPGPRSRPCHAHRRRPVNRTTSHGAGEPSAGRST
jgi:hypothetical protein